MNYSLKQIKEIAESDGERPCITALCQDWQESQAQVRALSKEASLHLSRISDLTDDNQALKVALEDILYLFQQDVAHYVYLDPRDLQEETLETINRIGATPALTAFGDTKR